MSVEANPTNSWHAPNGKGKPHRGNKLGYVILMFHVTFPADHI